VFLLTNSLLRTSEFQGTVTLSAILLPWQLSIPGAMPVTALRRTLAADDDNGGDDGGENSGGDSYKGAGVHVFLLLV
jgi:hypothetical protein